MKGFVEMTTQDGTRCLHSVENIACIFQDGSGSFVALKDSQRKDNKGSYGGLEVQESFSEMKSRISEAMKI